MPDDAFRFLCVPDQIQDRSIIRDGKYTHNLGDAAYPLLHAHQLTDGEGVLHRALHSELSLLPFDPRRTAVEDWMQGLMVMKWPASLQSWPVSFSHAGLQVVQVTGRTKILRIEFFIRGQELTSEPAKTIPQTS
jgi:hypothetical protein